MVDVRGDPWEHDPGPTPASGWAALFAETPNYRGLGHAVLGREVPLGARPDVFRGRLDGSAKVVLVGQEGAQDESLSHRSFTGGTGSRMQHLLRHIGLDRSYLFLNSLCVSDQWPVREPAAPAGAGSRSPIVIHRHRILTKAVVDGDVRLVIAVGRAAKESMATWIRSHGGTADPNRLDQATLGSLPGPLQLVGVVHPGSAAGGSTEDIRKDFQRACEVIRARVEADGGWLPTDPGVERNLAVPFQYRSLAIPHRDFPFGTCPRLGRGGTSSNRKDRQRSIQLYSANGHANARGDRIRYDSTAVGSREGYSDGPGSCPMSRRGHHPPPLTPARRPAWPGSCSGSSPVSPGRTLPPLGSPSTHPSGSAQSIAAGSGTSAWWCWPTRPPMTTYSPAGRCRGGGPAAGAVPAGRRAHPPLPDPTDLAGRHPGPILEPADQPGRSATGPGAASGAAAPDPGREPPGQRAAGNRSGGPTPRVPGGASRGGGHRVGRRRPLWSERVLAGGPGPAGHPHLSQGPHQPHLQLGLGPGQLPGSTCPMEPCGGWAAPATARSAPSILTRTSRHRTT